MFIVAEVAALSVRLPAYCRRSPKLIVLVLGVPVSARSGY